jgi:hypothetical protein
VASTLLVLRHHHWMAWRDHYQCLHREDQGGQDGQIRGGDGSGVGGGGDGVEDWLEMFVSGSENRSSGLDLALAVLSRAACEGGEGGGGGGGGGGGWKGEEEGGGGEGGGGAARGRMWDTCVALAGKLWQYVVLRRWFSSRPLEVKRALEEERGLSRASLLSSGGGGGGPATAEETSSTVYSQHEELALVDRYRPISDVACLTIDELLYSVHGHSPSRVPNLDAQRCLLRVVVSCCDDFPKAKGASYTT